MFFHRLGELRERTYENQRHRASGLNLVVAAVTRWNTVYLERVVAALQIRLGITLPAELPAYLSPLGWEHVNLTGDYVWEESAAPLAAGGGGRGQLRLLRRPQVKRTFAQWSL